MKKLLIIFALLSLQQVYAQLPAWEVNSSNFEFSMSYTGVALVNGTEAVDTEDRLAAWSDGELRGTAQPVYVANTDRYYFFLLIYSNGSGEKITFSYYDNSEQEIIDLKNEEIFVFEYTQGSFSTPYIFRDEYAAGFTSFALDNIEAEVVIDSILQTIVIEAGDVNPDSLVASFAMNRDATVTVAGVTQESGLTVNDFSAPLEYIVKDAKGSEYSWTITVNSEEDVTSVFEEALQHIGLKVYPTLTHGIINISAETAFDELLVVNIFGETFEQDAQAKTINLTNFPSGLYFLKIRVGNEWGTRRIIKE